ncbi:tRNA lysidine(34) synthetase TilS [Marivirga harenae]|uniref:tRNA lysidine(34) synthetase TilS n=1 Tax=Marivirga harenae TaxID=2010992 RepID=UPI0026DF6973|nr:tRNA lysidine(34) synthetase TilS [Marivirga harenae]WKV11845.1 tRNA lysidine(34) synthetase TilS [Marivirga harenae]|tara:strand:- start:22119 stop:23444 length:1326 start_codon:yes stop_codon:yes gene_type:complete
MLSESFLDFIKRERLFKKDEHLLLAISGGLDSVVLSHLLKLNNFQFSLAHMNFQLRGNDSELDEQFVRNLAKILGVRVFVKKVEIKKVGSTQIQARKLRYSWFEELIKEYSFSKLLTAHHANDLLETALLNLSRGTGVSGLRSILPLHDNIVRPLLFAEKEELQKFAEDNSIIWREDISNYSDHYTRNRIRHHIIPELLSINPNMVAGFQQTAVRLRATEAAWKEKLALISNKYFENEGQNVKIDKSILENENALVYLSELLSDYGIGLTQLQSFDFSRVGAQLFGSDYVLSVDRHFIFIIRAKNEDYYSFFPRELNLKEDSVEVPFGLLAWEFIDQQVVNFNQKPNVAFIDYDKLKGRVEIDIWHEGDKIQPLGMKGKKKISDILIDQKVPLHRKQQTIVLKCNEEIVWVVGYKFSDLFKVEKSSSRILRITYYENTKSI